MACFSLKFSTTKPGFDTDIFARGVRETLALEGGAIHFEMSALLQQFRNGLTKKEN